MMQGHKRTLISYAPADPKPKLQIAFGQRKRISGFFPGVQTSQEQSQNHYSPEQYHGRSTDISGRISEEASNKLNKLVDATNQTDYYGILERKASVRKKIPHYEFNPRRDRDRLSKLDVMKVSNKGREMSKMEVNDITKDKRNSKSSEETNGNRRGLESEIYMLKKEETIIIVNEKRRKSKFDVSQGDTQNEVTKKMSKDSSAKNNGTRESKVINQVGGDLKRKLRMKSDSASIVKKVSTSNNNNVSRRNSTLNQKKRESKIFNNLEQKKPSSKSEEIKVPTIHKRKNSKTPKANNIDVKDVKEINERKNSKSSHRKSKSRSNVKSTKDVNGSKSSEIKQNVSKFSTMKIDSKGAKEKTKSKNGSVIGKKRGSKEINSKKSSKSSKGRRKSKT